MVELILATYGLGCWLVFKKFKLVPINTYSVCTAFLGGFAILFGLMIILSICHPCSHDGRFYATVVQIVPQVRGRVVEVPVTFNKSLKAGDVLFRIDPRPFQLEVDRMEAMLAGMNAKVAQLDARRASARAATEVAESDLLVSESEFDRQARISIESADAQVDAVQSRLKLAQTNLDRIKQLDATGAISKQELDTEITRVEALTAELAQATNAQLSAQEKLQSGGNRLKSMQNELKQAQAQEREAVIALEAESDGMNPDVRQTMAELEHKRWELEQTVVSAPSDGFVTQITLRPGQMVSSFNTNAAMLFIPKEKRFLVASYPQNAIAGIEPGLEAELAFEALPGQIFKAKVVNVMGIIAQGQFVGTGQLQSTVAASASDNVPVLFEYGEELDALNVPTGAQVSIAVYTHNFHVLSILRKIILRIKSWENYAFFMKNFDSLH